MTRSSWGEAITAVVVAVIGVIVWWRVIVYLVARMD